MAGSLILERFRAAPGKALYPEVSLEAEEGSIVGILGRSGIGKTTLLRAILGTVPSAGKAFIGDEDLGALTLSERVMRFGVVPQDSSMLLPLTVEEAVLASRAGRYGIFGRPAESDHREMLETLREFRIEVLRKRACSSLSGGEREQVLMASASFRRSGAYLLDEPESGLDPALRARFIGFASGEAKKGGIVLIVTHNPDNLLRLSRLVPVKALLLSRDHAEVMDAEELSAEVLSRLYGVRMAESGEGAMRHFEAVPWSGSMPSQPAAD